MLQKYLYYTSIMLDAPEIALNFAQNDAGIIRQTIRWAINLRPLIIGILGIYPRVLIFPSRPSWPKNWVEVSSWDCQLAFECYCKDVRQNEKEQEHLNILRGSPLRCFLGLVYGTLQKKMHGSGHRRVVRFFSTPIFKTFILTLLFAVSRLYSNVVNSYITCKIWSPYTFQDNLNK